MQIFLLRMHFAAPPKPLPEPLMIYADYNATAPLRPEARDAMLAALESGANPSSVHAAGRAARKILERAREQVGAAIGSRAQDVIFTSGGTEANALALQGAVEALDGAATLLVSAIEHEAVSRAAAHAGAPVETVYVTPDGRVDLERLADRLKRWDRTLSGTPILSLMIANNETGVIQPVSEAAALVRAADGLVHCDAVQGLGKIPVNVALLGVDYLSLSAHKAGGPQGVGAVWLRPGAPLRALQHGGGQERSLRSGTENLAGIAGFGAAAERAVADLPDFGVLAARRDAMEARLRAAGAVVFGEDAPRLANTSNFALEGLRGETQIMALDLAGFCVSAGAACSSGKVNRSLVLSAMGASDALAESAIRASFGWDTNDTDFDALADAWYTIARRVRRKEAASHG